MADRTSVRPGRVVAGLLDAQRGHLFPWVPVCFATGIGLYFALPAEPGPAAWAVLAAAALASLALPATRHLRAPLLIGLLALAAGLLAAGTRSAMVAEPVLAFRYYGPIEGRIVGIDRSVSDKPRLTLDRVYLAGVAPDRTPARVRVSLHGPQDWITPEPGLTVMLTGHLSPPSGPVEPGGFDFRRQAFFQGLGAVGYTRTPVLVRAPAREGQAGLAIFRIRMGISTAVQAAMPGPTGAFAAAITTGDRSGMDAATLEALRASNLAHLLAISGLHMGLLTGFVFAAIRFGLALVPPLALRWPVKKIAAVGALVAGAAYLALSGGNVATERAFVMVAVVLTAVLVDRRALTLRAVALAALIVLTLRPEALLGPGFQMSFAATTALIFVFGLLREAERTRVPRWVRPVIALLVSSAVAGLATAPYAAAHFNQVPHYGLLANTLSVPLMGAVIIPAAVLAALLAPFGLAWIGFAVMEPAIGWILGVAAWVAGLDGALSVVHAPSAAVLPLLTLGALWIILWQGRWRLAGLAPVLAAFVLWAATPRPVLLVSDTGGLVGLMTEAGRALSKPRGDGFAAMNWLENDGDPALQADAALRPGVTADGAFSVADLDGVHVYGRGAAERAVMACGRADIVVTPADAPPGAGPCLMFDRRALAQSGAVAFHDARGGLRRVSVRDSVGRRPWALPQ